VVEKFVDVCIEKSGLNYTCSIEAWATATELTAPHAICLAVLKAVGGGK
jgi:hypothetical protein